MTAGGAAAHTEPAARTSASYCLGTDPDRSPPPVPGIGGAPADALGTSSSSVIIATSPSTSTLADATSHLIGLPPLRLVAQGAGSFGSCLPWDSSSRRAARR